MLGDSISLTIWGDRLVNPVPLQYHDNDISLTAYAFTKIECLSPVSFGEEIGDSETHLVHMSAAIK